VSQNRLYSRRRLLLQIGGANIAGADRADQPPISSSLEDEKRVLSLLLSTAAHDPSYPTNASLCPSLRG